MKLIEEELYKFDEMRTQSEEIYLKHIKKLQKENKVLQNEAFRQKGNIDPAAFQKELYLKKEEINLLKMELDRQNNENEREIQKIYNV